MSKIKSNYNSWVMRPSLFIKKNKPHLFFFFFKILYILILFLTSFAIAIIAFYYCYSCIDLNTTSDTLALVCLRNKILCI